MNKNPKFSIHSIRVKIFILSFCCIAVSAGVIGVTDVIKASHILNENSETMITQMCSAAAKDMDIILSGVEQSVNMLADYVVRSIPDAGFMRNPGNVRSLTEDLLGILDNTATHTTKSLCAYIRYNPDFTEPTSGLFLTRNSENEKFASVTPTDFSVFDKNDIEHVGWYYIPVNNGRPTWMSPYQNANVDVLMISYVIPIFIGGTSIGVVGLDVELNSITGIIERTRAADGHGYYSFLTAPDGTVYNHPRLKLDSNINDGNTSMQPLATAMRFSLTSSGLIPFTDGTTGEQMRCSFTTLTNGMKFVLAYPENQTRAHAKTLAKLNSGISMMILLVMGTFAFIIGKRISVPLISTRSLLREISCGEGDLTRRLTVTAKDESGQLSEYFNTFMEFLHEMISRVVTETNEIGTIKDELRRNTESVRNDAELIGSNITNMNFQTEEQSASVTETSATIQQIVRTVEQLSGKIENQSAAVSQSSAAIRQMITNIDSITEKLRQASDSFAELTGAATDGGNAIKNVQQLVGAMEEQSAHLLETNAVIDSIASSTNLLAMNAAIEAAHAGESGKGFAVVADEIRTLAENSAEQSKGIAEGMKNIVDTIKTVVSAAGNAGKTFDQVAEMITRMNALVSEVSEAMNSQNEGNRQVLDALSNIQEITQAIQDGSQEMNSGARMIMKEMERLESVSMKVQVSSREITEALNTINTSISGMEDGTRRNADAVSALNSLTGKFKI